MIKKLTLLIFLASLLPIAAASQALVGSWKAYPAFGAADAIVETPDLVYLVSDGSLHSYDKKNDETRSYQPGIDLSRGMVSDIFYNPDGGYALVSFSDGNIDLLYDNGERQPLPDIRDANVNIKRSVNDVAFDGNLIYVATSFGLVIFDEKSATVKDSGVYNVGLSSVAVAGDEIFVTPTGGDFESKIIKIEKGKRINNINNFTSLGYLREWSSKLYTLPWSDASGSSFIAEHGMNGRFYIFEINPQGMQISEPFFNNLQTITPVADGLNIVADGALYHLSAPDKMTKLADLPSPIASDMVTTLSGTSSLWASNINGLGHYRLESDGKLSVLSDRYRNPGSTTFSDISRIFPTREPGKFLVSNLGMSAHNAVGSGDFFSVVFKGNLFDNGDISNIDVTGDLTITTSPGIDRLQYQGNNIFSPTFVLQDPDDERRFYIGSSCEGVYVIKDGEELGRFAENSKIHKAYNWAWRPNTGKIDEKGNLIIGVYTGDATKPALVVLPADKRLKNPSSVTQNDWVGINTGTQITQRDIEFIICKSQPVIFICDASFYTGFTAVYIGESITDTSDDRNVVVSNFVDQDGKTFAPDYINCFAEDNNGRVWVGTNMGIFEISSPGAVFQSDMRINRLKVPRNDGTNLADYLLDNEDIRCIAVDASNRKWIGTKNSGLYLVTSDGSEVLAHFDNENSPLSTNEITWLYVNPASNSVYVSTLGGLYEYSSDSAPAAPDYSNVYAYPNPVEPGYTGWITITGLMDSSLVKIMDAGMHLVYQTTSEGGMALWDGCSMTGARVKSGVYYVLASSSDDTQSNGDVVAKILVIN